MYIWSWWTFAYKIFDCIGKTLKGALTVSILYLNIVLSKLILIYSLLNRNLHSATSYWIDTLVKPPRQPALIISLIIFVLYLRVRGIYLCSMFIVYWVFRLNKRLGMLQKHFYASSINSDESLWRNSIDRHLPSDSSSIAIAIFIDSDSGSVTAWQLL